VAERFLRSPSQRLLLANLIDLCVPGMGTILWGESPLYIIWK